MNRADWQFEPRDTQPPHDQHEFVKVVEVVRDNATGEQRSHPTTALWSEDGPCTYIWEEGNYSCDCNRRLSWLRGDGRDEEAQALLGSKNLPCSDGKFSVNLVNLQTQEVFYQEFNDDGPLETPKFIYG
jgi:hypothetical protein